MACSTVALTSEALQTLIDLSCDEVMRRSEPVHLTMLMCALCPEMTRWQRNVITSQIRTVRSWWASEAGDWGEKVIGHSGRALCWISQKHKGFKYYSCKQIHFFFIIKQEILGLLPFFSMSCNEKCRFSLNVLNSVFQFVDCLLRSTHNYPTNYMTIP